MYDFVFDFLSPHPQHFQTSNRKIRFIMKSRNLMISWSVMGWATARAMTVPEQEIIVQSQTEKKGVELIGYAKTLWEQQPAWLREMFPLKAGYQLSEMARNEFSLANGSRILAFPQGAEKIKTFHPSVLIMDEAAFQPEGQAAYADALPVAQYIIGLSSAGPGWYADLIEADIHPHRSSGQFYSPMRGIHWRETSRGIPALWVHYSADPARDEQWAEREKKFYPFKSQWDAEQEMEAGAGGGERILEPTLMAREKDILIRDESWKPQEGWLFDAGFDYGKSNPSPLIVFATDWQGTVYAIGEHYRGGLSIGEHLASIQGMKVDFGGGKRVPVLDLCGSIFSDPRIFDEVESQNRGDFQSVARIFSNLGMKHLKPGIRGGDIAFAALLEHLWSFPDPKFKIVCPQPYDKKSEGTRSLGCPNLVWELLNVRREEYTDRQLQSHNPSEKLVQRNNHAFDAAKYRFSMAHSVPTRNREYEWSQRVQSFEEHNPSIDEISKINSLIVMRRNWESRQSRTLTWK